MALTKVTTGGITDATIATADIAADAVTSAKLADNAVVTAAINGGAVTNTKLAADAVTNAKIADDAIDSEHYVDGSIDNAHLADDAVGVAELSATGTASSSTFLRGDNSWATPTDTNTVTTINNNADNRVITGSGTANTLEGEASLTFDAGLLKIDDTGGTAGKGRLEFGNSGEQFIEGFDTGNAGSGSYLKFGDGSTERMRVGQNGQVYVGCTDQLSDYASDKTKLSIWHTGDSGGYLEVGGDQTANGYSAGSILFCNTNNSSSITNVGMQRAEIVTSDSNAGDDSGADLVFYNRPEGGGNLDESFRIKSTKDVQITDGNLIVANGHGIDFSATGGPANGSGTSELLDDYETGTWTPSVGTYGGVTGTRSFSRQDGYYVKIGRMVFCWMDWVIDSWSGGTGYATVYGLPFAKNILESLSSYHSGLTVWWAANTVTGSKANITGWISENETHYRLFVGDTGESSALSPNFTGRVSANFIYTTSS